MTENHTDRFVLPRTTLGELKSGPNATRRQVTQTTAGFARTRRERLTFPGSQTI
jgi:hypothetical protein